MNIDFSNIKLNPPTIGHYSFMDKIGFNKLETGSLESMLIYLAIFTLPVDEIRKYDPAKFMDDISSTLFSTPVTALDLPSLEQALLAHAKEAHANDFEAKDEKKTPKKSPTKSNRSRR